MEGALSGTDGWFAHGTGAQRPMRLVTLAAVAVATMGAALPLAAQATLQVTRNVNLRRDPSTTHPRILLLRPPDEVDLLDTVTVNGFRHVVTEEDDSGWVWGRNVRLVPPQPFPSGEIADSISTGWEHPPGTTRWFVSGVDSCGPTGSGAGDTATNRRKNREDVPAAYHPARFPALSRLPSPQSAPRNRGQWTPAQLQVIAPYEGAAVAVIGYIVAIKPQTGGSGESTNCHWHAAVEVDWHIALVNQAGQGEASAVVVETTPRVRRRHSGWTVARLSPWLDAPNQVRIGGWLMFDPQHPDHLGKYRQTLWEIHPITRIEVWRDSAWVNLDSLP
jgi:hypothetical protein